MELLGQSYRKLNLLYYSISGVPIHNKPCGTAFNSVSTANQVSLWLNYLCQELKVRLHEQCVLFNKTWIQDQERERTLTSQIGFF